MMYKIMPASYKRKIKKLLVDSGSKKSPEKFTNNTFIISLMAGIVMGVLSWSFFFIMIPLGFLGIFALLHGFLMLAVEKRARFVENILPDALQLMAANTRAGYIPSRALLLSARKEFGPLADAIRLAGKEMMTGKSLDKSLETITKTIKSEILERSIKLIIWGSKSGGQLAELLDQNAEDIRRKQGIMKEVRANVTMYVIFIAFAGCLGAPVLYALSHFLATTIGSLGASAAMPDAISGQVSFLQFTGVQISSEFLFFFSITAIFITTFFGGLIIGSISAGTEKAGVKFVPILMFIGYGAFFATQAFISATFGALIP